MKPKQILMLLMAIRVRVISIIIILFILTACVVAKMPTSGDSTQRVQPEPTPTLGLLYIEETVVDPGYASVYDPYPVPVPYP